MDYLIIGHGAAGINAAEAIRTRDKKGRVTIVTNEAYQSYSRPLTTYYIAGDVSEAQMTYRQPEFYKEQDIDVRLNKQVAEIDLAGKSVSLEGKGAKTLPYDRLLLASGGSPAWPEIKGRELQGVFVLRQLEDAKKISERAKTARNAVMIGGGFVCMKTAEALHRRGLNITVVVTSDRLLSQMIDFDAAAVIRKQLEHKGWTIITEDDVEEILPKKAGASSPEVGSVRLTSGQTIQADLVVIGKGVAANLDLPAQAGLKVNTGIIVDDFMRTSDENVYAAGDVAETIDIATGKRACNAIWPCASEQGQIAGLNMAGAKRRYPGSIRLNSIDFFGLPCISLGITNPKGKGFDVLVKHEPDENFYRKLVFKKGLLKGAIFVGDIDRAGIITGLLKEKVDVSDFKEDLMQNFGLGALPKALRKNKVLKQVYG